MKIANICYLYIHVLHSILDLYIHLLHSSVIVPATEFNQFYMDDHFPYSKWYKFLIYAINFSQSNSRDLKCLIVICSYVKGGE